MDEERNSVTLTVHVNTGELDAVTEKAEQLVALLEKANSLAGELASKEINLQMNVEL